MLDIWKSVAGKTASYITHDPLIIEEDLSRVFLGHLQA